MASRHMRPSDHRRIVVTGYIAERIRTEEDRHGRGYIAQLARETGFSGPHLGGIRDGSKNAGEDVIQALARAWAFKDAAALVAAADEWWDKQDPKDAKTIEARRPTRASAKERYPNRQQALLSIGREVSPEAVRRVREMHLHAHVDPPVGWWIQQALAMQALVDAELAAQGPETETARAERDTAEARDVVEQRRSARKAKHLK